MISVLDKLLQTNDDTSIIHACQTFNKLRVSQNFEEDWELTDYYNSILQQLENIRTQKPNPKVLKEVELALGIQKKPTY